MTTIIATLPTLLADALERLLFGDVIDREAHELVREIEDHLQEVAS